MTMVTMAPQLHWRSCWPEIIVQSVKHRDILESIFHVTLTTTSATATSSLKINTVGSFESTRNRFLRDCPEPSVNETKPKD